MPTPEELLDANPDPDLQTLRAWRDEGAISETEMHEALTQLGRCHACDGEHEAETCPIWVSYRNGLERALREHPDPNDPVWVG